MSVNTDATYLHPAACHALALLDDCDGDVEQARSLAHFALCQCPTEHWRAVHSILSAEGAEA